LSAAKPLLWMEEKQYASSLITHSFSSIKKYFLTVNKKDV
jgi:hypothetical protein